MSNLNKFNTDLLNTLSEEEKRQVLSIMKEFSIAGADCVFDVITDDESSIEIYQVSLYEWRIWHKNIW